MTLIQRSANQMVKAVLYLRQAPDFIRSHKLWKGYLAHGWMAQVTIIVAVIFSYKFFVEFKNLVTSPQVTGDVAQSSLSFASISEIGSGLVLSGGMKYLILIVLEMVIFHFAVKTYEVLSGEKRDLKVKDFIDAQIRMIKVVIRSWIYEILLGLLVVMALGLLGLKSLAPGFDFLIQCFFIGVAFIDNYNEQFGLTVKESFKISYSHLGAALIIGITAYLLLLIPLVGAILAPFICAVGATCYMFYSHSDLNLEPSI